MTTDNRTSEPAPEQVEAAAKVLRADEGFMAEVHSALEVSWSEYIARLVLVAAQGAAPQAKSEQPWNDPSDPNSPQFDSPWEKAAALIRSIRCAQWDILERRDQEDVRVEINGLIDRLDELATTMLAAPVLPSSGVDEEKLAEVIAHSCTEWEREWSECLDGKADDPGPSGEYIARDVRAYLTGDKA